MGILTIDTKDNWDRVEQSIKGWQQRKNMGDERTMYDEKDADGKTLSRRLFDEMQMEIEEALKPVRIDKGMLLNQITKLCMANNTDRALKLIKVCRSDLQLRWPVQLVVNILMIPFRIIYGIIKLIAP